jgi:serine/threonine protein kinase
VSSGELIAARYCVDRILGRGATGTVCLATEHPSGQTVAIKLIHEHLVENKTAVRRFRREARSIARLAHPHVVRVLDAGMHGKRPYLVMEFLEGRDLAALITPFVPIPFARIHRLVSQILAGLKAIHKAGLIHRDLKPGNIIVVEHNGDADFVKVCDFGLAKAIASPLGTVARESLPTTGSGALSGTPEYMAPEQILSDEIDARADLYAVAVMLYQLVTGTLPFSGASAWAVLAHQLRDAPERPSLRRPDLFIPERLDDLILAGLAKDRAQRPSLDEIATELDGIAGADWNQLPRFAQPTVSVASLPQTLQEVSGPIFRSKRSVVMLTLAGVLAAGAGWAVATETRDRPVNGDGTRLVQTAESHFSTAWFRAPTDADSPPKNTAGAQKVVAAKAVRRTKVRPQGRTAKSSPEAITVRDVDVNVGANIEQADNRPDSHHRTAADLPRVPVLDMAASLLAEGSPLRACEIVEAAKKRQSSDPALSRFLGQCYMRIGGTARAKENYEEYLRLAPDSSDAAFVAGIIR